MDKTQANLIARDDTFFGVCQAIGDDLGFNPLWLRLALATGVLVNPTAVVAVYVALGVVVLATRLLFPVAKRAATAETPVVEAPAAEPANEEAPFEYAKAA